MNAEIIGRIAREDYDQIDAVNWSSLKHMDVSPLHYQHALHAPHEPSASMVLGTVTHMAILEPDRLATEVAVPPDEVLASNGSRRGKAWEAWRDENSHKIIITASQLDHVRAMSAAVRSHRIASLLLTQGHAEQAITWTDAKTDTACKGIIDWLIPEAGDVLSRLLGCRPDQPILVDLKTAQTVTPRRFSSQFARLGYHGQLAHYAAGVEAVTGCRPMVMVIAVENEAPFDVAVFEVGSDDTLWAGEEWRDELMARLVEAREVGRWVGQAPSVVPIEMPAWAFPGEDDPLESIRVGREV